MNNKILLKIVLLYFIFFTILQINSIVCAAGTAGLTNNWMYNIRNRNSGKYLNVNYGIDANGTNVNQYTYDGSNEQKFTLDSMGGDRQYRLYAYCSETRVLDVYRPLQNNANVDIWTHDDNDAQIWKIENLGNGYYSIKLAYDTNLALTAYGTENGGGSGKTSTSPGNVFVSTYTGATNQQWSFERTTALLDWDLVNSNKHMYWTGSTNYMTEFSAAVSTWNGIIPGLISETHVMAEKVTIFDFYEENTNVVGQTSSSGTIKFNSYFMNNYHTSLKQNVCVHELGHALRLDHVREPGSVMYYSVTSTTTPSTNDRWNLLQAYSLYY